MRYQNLNLGQNQIFKPTYKSNEKFFGWIFKKSIFHFWSSVDFWQSKSSFWWIMNILQAAWGNFWPFRSACLGKFAWQREEKRSREIGGKCGLKWGIRNANCSYFYNDYYNYIWCLPRELLSFFLQKSIISLSQSRGN